LVTGVPLLKLKTAQTTGKLLWRSKAPQIDQPFADFLDQLMAPFPGQRPQTTEIILQRLEKIPFQSKLNRAIKSKPFQFALVSLSLLLAFGAYKASLPWFAHYFLEQGKKAQLENRNQSAQQKFQLATKLNPNTTYSISSFYFEQASRHQTEPEVAKKNYELAIKYNPQDIAAYNNLALICQEIQDLDCVNNNYKNLFKLQPNNWEGHFGLGSFYDDLGKYDLAEQQYKLAIQSSKQAVNAISNLARLKNKSGEYQEAIKLTRQGLSMTQNPEWQAALYKNLGWAQLALKQYTKAQTNLQRAKDLDPQRTDAYCLLAQAQEALGEIADARISWEVCLLSNSSLPEVQSWRQQILDRLIQQKE
jgi:tetratricopeptide (TPR) repeat protein